jgi:zinc protease
MFHKDKMILELIQSILAGQGGRLFLELRDKESLAYSVSPLKMDGLEMGYFGCYIGCAPEKTQKAISMMKAELKKLQDTLVSEEEILRSKKYLIGRTHIDLQRSGAQGSSMLYELIYGLDPNESFEIERHLQKITAQDIKRVAKDVFKGEPYLSIVTKS